MRCSDVEHAGRHRGVRRPAKHSTLPVVISVVPTQVQDRCHDPRMAHAPHSPDAPINAQTIGSTWRGSRPRSAAGWREALTRAIAPAQSAFGASGVRPDQGSARRVSARRRGCGAHTRVALSCWWPASGIATVHLSIRADCRGRRASGSDVIEHARTGEPMCDESVEQGTQFSVCQALPLPDIYLPRIASSRRCPQP
jgi:hypothetical protein